MKIQKIEIDKIRLDGGTQMRVAIDNAVVSEYADKLNDLPPPIVYFDGANHWLAEGFHRYHAHASRKSRRIECEVRTGTCRDAIMFSAGANSQHGLPRTNADKRKAVNTLLSDPEWSQLSNREIARRCAVSHEMVCQMRDERVSTVDSAIQPNPHFQSKNEDSQNNDPAENASSPRSGSSDYGASSPRPPKWPARCQLAMENAFIMFDRAIELHRQITNEIQSIVGEGPGEKPVAGGEELAVKRQSILTTLSALGAQLADDRPHAVCPQCKGTGQRCQPCKDRGWITKRAYDRLPLRQQQQARVA